MFSLVMIEGIMTLVKTVIVKGEPVQYIIDPQSGMPIEVLSK